MNTDQNNQPIIFSVVGLAICAGIYAFTQVPAVREFAVSSLWFLFLVLATAAVVMIGREAKEAGASVQPAITLIHDSAVAIAAAVVAVSFVAHFGITPTKLHVAGATAEMIATSAVARFLFPGDLYFVGKPDNFRSARWLMLSLAFVLALPYLQS